MQAGPEATSPEGTDATLRLDDLAHHIQTEDHIVDPAPVAPALDQTPTPARHAAPTSSAQKPHRRRRNWLIAAAVVVVAALALGGWLWQRSRTNSASGTTQTITYTVASTTLQQSVTTTGTFAPAVQDNLSFPASGTVSSVLVKVGDKVTKGETLATQQTTSLQAAVASAQATVDAANSNLSSLQASSTTTAVQLSSAQAALASDNAKLSQEQDNLAGATMTSPITGIVAQVNITAGSTASGTSAGSSTSGSGTGSGSGGSGGSYSGSGSSNSNANSNSSSSSSTGQIVVVDTSSWIVNATVSAADLPSLTSGLQATMNLNAGATTSNSGNGSGYSRGSGGFGGGFGGLSGGGFGGTRTNQSGSSQNGTSQSGTNSTSQTSAEKLVFGTVQSISQIASSSSGAAAFPVTIEVTGKPTGVYIGSTASVSIMVKQLANVLAVPTAAISEQNGTPTVQVQVNGQNQTREITVGQVYGAQTEVTKGLHAGDVVVVGTRTRTVGSGSGRGYGGYGGLGSGAASAQSSAGGR